MKKYIVTLLLALGIPLLLSADYASNSSRSSSYDIIGIYKKIDLDNGSKVLDSYGNVEDAEAVFEPSRLDLGRYEAELTKIDTDFYHICGTDYYIETRYCYEYASWEDVILNITTNYGYTRGEVIFF